MLKCSTEVDGLAFFYINLSLLSLLTGNQTNWWWFGRVEVDGNPPRLVLD